MLPFVWYFVNYFVLFTIVSFVQNITKATEFISSSVLSQYFRPLHNNTKLDFALKKLCPHYSALVNC